jgi:hypothetical protein
MRKGSRVQHAGYRAVEAQLPERGASQYHPTSGRDARDRRMRISLTTALAIFFILDRLRHPLGRSVSKRGRFGA